MDYIPYKNHTTIDDLIGKTITQIAGLESGCDFVTFTCDDGEKFAMFHSQDCCESVSVDDVEGDIGDLIGSPVVLAEESTSSENPDGVPGPEYQDSFTWTFYRIATAKGYVVIRWYGESNGYYSESVDFAKITN